MTPLTVQGKNALSCQCDLSGVGQQRLANLRLEQPAHRAIVLRRTSRFHNHMPQVSSASISGMVTTAASVVIVIRVASRGASPPSSRART